VIKRSHPTSRLYRAGLLGGFLALASCSSSNPPDDSELAWPPLDHLDEALHHQIDFDTADAMDKLSSALDASDWDYLLEVEWPDEGVEVVLADPVLRKAVLALDPSAFAPVIAPHDEGAPSIGNYYEQARKLMQNANGVAGVDSPGGASAFVQGLVLTGGTHEVSPPKDADDRAKQCVTEFFGGGRSSTTCRTPTLCCKGVIDFNTTGELDCQDSTSCMGQGLPPDPSDKFTGGGPAPFVCDGHYLLSAMSLASSNPYCDVVPQDVPAWTAAIDIHGTQGTMIPSAPFTGTINLTIEQGCYAHNVVVKTNEPCAANNADFLYIEFYRTDLQEFNEKATHGTNPMYCQLGCTGIPKFSVVKQ
jgi:hypothetical protein